MSDAEYVPPKIWTWNRENGGRFANINRPVAGATHEKELPVGRHPMQLYSLGTPNGVKVTVMLVCVGTLLLYFGWDLLFATGRFQLLIYSGLMIALMLWLPNGLLSLMDRKEAHK
jgi:hypothetical protein